VVDVNLTVLVRCDMESKMLMLESTVACYMSRRVIVCETTGLRCDEEARCNMLGTYRWSFSYYNLLAPHFVLDTNLTPTTSMLRPFLTFSE
jgi:hypothetical protein